MIVSILVFSLLVRPDFLHRVIFKLTLLPVFAGISYEALKIVELGLVDLAYRFVYPRLLVTQAFQIAVFLAPLGPNLDP